MTKYKVTKILLGNIVIATETNNKIKVYIRTGIDYIITQNYIGNLNEFIGHIKDIAKNTASIYNISDKIIQKKIFINE